MSTSSLEAVYQIREAASATPQNESRFSTSENPFVAWMRTQFTATPEGKILNGTLLAVIAILAMVMLVVGPTTTAAHSVVEAPAVWVSEDGSTVYAEGEAIIGSSSHGEQ